MNSPDMLVITVLQAGVNILAWNHKLFPKGISQYQKLFPRRIFFCPWVDETGEGKLPMEALCPSLCVSVGGWVLNSREGGVRSILGPTMPCSHWTIVALGQILLPLRPYFSLGLLLNSTWFVDNKVVQYYAPSLFVFFLWWNTCARDFLAAVNKIRSDWTTCTYS